MNVHADQAAPDWQPTGERRWRVVKRIAGYRTVRAEQEEIDMNSGERRWVAFPHGATLQHTPAGMARRPTFERTEKDTKPETEVLPWTEDE
jgi:hypothetical protein